MKNSADISIDGLILAGGQSRRMGEDKAQLLVAGKSLLQHHLNVMLPRVAKLYIADNRHVEEIKPEGVVYIHDHFLGSEGPLSGILSALAFSDADYLWVMSCDNYALPDAIFLLFKQVLLESDADIVCLKVAGRHQPLISMMRCNLDDSLSAYMASGARAVLRWYNSLNVAFIDVDEHVDVKNAAKNFWPNINTQEDYLALLKSL
ncbi:MAG: molybdenum cofactor guanylyltransferase [Pseudomonadales bacterium]|nr:molybdenum cofactor guanylyltransferase [Pseudomonadales bacterium]